MNNRLSEDEQIAMLIVTFCNIGDVQTFFETDRDSDCNVIKQVRTSMHFTPPGSNSFLEPRAFLKSKPVQGALKMGLFRAEEKKYLEAHKKAFEYITNEGLMQK